MKDEDETDCQCDWPPATVHPLVFAQLAAMARGEKLKVSWDVRPRLRPITDFIKGKGFH